MRRRDSEFAEFFDATWSRLYRTTYAVAGDHSRTEDALQTAFAKTYASWWRVSKADNPEAYVRRMAINAALSAHRTAAARHESPVNDVAALAGPGPVEPLLLVDEGVWAAIRALPPRQRAVMVLRYREDLSEKEIADVLGCRPGTVKSHSSAALATLRRRLSTTEIKQGERQ
jgi:RNA polymerase sigma-70 factor (sigma-E family)